MALLLAAGPTLGALAAAQAANPHAGMAMSDSGADDGCCDHSTPDDTTVCAAHCAAGIIVAPMVFVPSDAVSISVASVVVLPSASHAPVPDIAPPKSSAA
ncbi:MAG TPA: hypothetical protein VEU32_18040 [Burkholderiales bacterium]|nr:hypothetical protein [Burkholderiales bacterium]